MRTWHRYVGALAAACLLAVSHAAALARNHDSEATAYLVGFHDGASPRGLTIAGLRVQQEWPDLGAARVMATPAAVAQLRAHHQVAYVEEDRPVQALGHGAPYEDAGAIPWGLQAVHAQEAWAQGATGSGIKVCVLDTGIDYNHPVFYRNGVPIVTKSANFVGDGKPNAADGHGHGTHVAGTIAAQGSTLQGVAPGVELYIARVLGDDGNGTTSGVINGLNWCVQQGAHVANLSLGSSSSNRTEQRAFDNAYSAGMLSIAASGNAGTRKIGYPAAYSSVVAVGAVDANLAIASFSNTGREQELAAPGVSIYSSVPVGMGRAASLSVGTAEYPANGLEFSPTGSATGPLVECGLATSTSSCSGQPSSGQWIALISRGEITFADKVRNVMAQGAAAAIITNNDTANPNDAGSFTLGEALDWIPALSVSYNSGVAIRSGGLGNGQATLAAADYDRYDGTSMASPHAAGVAAVAWSAKPALSNAEIRAILQATAMDLGSSGRDQTFGYGLPLADAAAQRASTTEPGGGGGGGKGKGSRP